jgi:tRNA (guanine-N7-)-methyltransferase
MSERKHNTDGKHRRIRSFVRREGRLTPAQERALDELWPLYGLSARQRLKPPEVFGRRAPVTLEIGFGNGESLAEMASREPGTNFIGIEVHRPGVGRLLNQLKQQELTNVRIFCHDAVEILSHCIDDHSLDRVLLFFPDPWPKKKHHKRRIVQTAFIQLLANKLKHGGRLHMATDWQPYAEHMLEVMQASAALFMNVAGKDQYSLRPAYRPVTKFEQRGQRLGHGVWDLIFQRTDARTSGAAGDLTQ